MGKINVNRKPAMRQLMPMSTGGMVIAFSLKGWVDWVVRARLLSGRV